MTKRDWDNPEYLKIKDSERAAMEQMSFNFFNYVGKKMQIPSRLFEELERGGVRMTWMEKNNSFQ